MIWIASTTADTNELTRRPHVDVEDDGRSPQRECRKKRQQFAYAIGQRKVTQAGITQ